MNMVSGTMVQWLKELSALPVITSTEIKLKMSPTSSFRGPCTLF